MSLWTLVQTSASNNHRSALFNSLASNCARAELSQSGYSIVVRQGGNNIFEGGHKIGLGEVGWRKF